MKHLPLLTLCLANKTFTSIMHTKLDKCLHTGPRAGGTAWWAGICGGGGGVGGRQRHGQCGPPLCLVLRKSKLTTLSDPELPKQVNFEMYVFKDTD